MGDKGLDADGFIAREGSLSLVQKEFTAVVEAAREEITTFFGRTRLHSAYLHGSVPRGTAVPGVSDLNVLLVLHHEFGIADRVDADGIEAHLDASFPQIDGVGIVLSDTGEVLSDLEHHGFGWFVACLCTPLFGDDLATILPRYRPISLLAREGIGGLGEVLWVRREYAPLYTSDAERGELSRDVARLIVRAGFTLVMPRWGGWTSDLTRAAEIFAAYYPERADQMRLAAATARIPAGDPATLGMLLDDLGPWLAAEHDAVHGQKIP
ncbi:nucleotidyltransferase [Actinocorallia sp. B10E7]|uniref:nucleotidyltransferase n=1 Tax=Actinocorallia sp. B10E7 TaxID=3153558 RepID=UPI00325EB63D